MESMNLEYIMDIIIIIIETIYCFIFFDVFAVRRKKNKSERIIAFCVQAVLIRICAHYLKMYLLIKIPVVILIMISVMLFLYEVTVIKALVLVLLAQGIMTIIDYILIIIFGRMYGDILAMDGGSDLIGRLMVILSRLVVFVSFVILNRIVNKKKINESEMSNKEWGQFLIFPIFTIGIVIMMTDSMLKAYHSDIVNVYYVIAVGLIIMNIVMFYLINEIIENSQKMKETELLRQQSDYQMELYNAMCRNFDLQRQRTHEYKNQIVCMDMLVKKKEYNKLEKYISNISEGLDTQFDIVDTNNEVVNAILNAKYNDAIHNDVLLILKISDMSGIRVSDEDMVTILSNLIDNAIEAAKQCEPGQRIVKLKMLYEDNVLNIAVSNTYKNEPMITEEGYICTTKDDKDVHGWGIRNIVTTLEKYNAEHIIDYKNGEFVFSIIM